MDVQTINIEMDRFLEQKIRSMIKKLKGLLPAANWIAIHLKKSVHQASYPGKVSVRLGIPGPDIIASDSGYNWKTMLKNVEKKLIRQLNKKKRL
jgi:putative sigma-54 modulation protein